MTTEPPRLTLDPPHGQRERSRLPWVLLLVLAMLGLQAFTLWRAESSGKSATAVNPSAELPPQALKEAALVLEDKSLPREAAKRWEEYLALQPHDPDRVEIRYRAGNLRKDSGDLEEAAAHYVVAELQAKSDGKAPPKALAQNLTDCLRLLGLYGEVGRELARRVDANVQGSDSSAPVVAEYAGESLTEADLDRMIEQQVDHALLMQGGGNSEMRDRILSELEAPERKMELLQQFLQTELMARRAREQNLQQSEEYRRALTSAEQSLLASQYLKGELQSARPTAADIEAYFQAHSAEYAVAERTQTLLLPLEADEDVEATLRTITSAEEFRSLAGERAPKDHTPLQRSLEAGRADELLGAELDALLHAPVGSWTHQPVEHEGRRFLVLVEERTPARTPSLEESQVQVTQDYLRRKQKELTQKIFEDLQRRYEVQIHAEALQKNKGGGG